MTTVNATDLQNNFGRFLQCVINGTDFIITKNGKEVARLISNQRTVEFLTDSLKGVLTGDYDDKAMRKERFELNEDIG